MTEADMVARAREYLRPYELELSSFATASCWVAGGLCCDSESGGSHAILGLVGGNIQPGKLEWQNQLSEGYRELSMEQPLCPGLE